ncbi:MAG: hypothetical protein HKP44_08275 [Desulfofustis sp.]|nr:hypothetical protein [Desulfofustis sp.]
MTTPTDDIEALVEDEWYAVRYSGEIPEVAYHGAVFHLTEAANGPQLELSRSQQSRLLEAVIQRYLEITIRDLLPENKETTGYRGLKRSYINWQRFLIFCERNAVNGFFYQKTIATALTEFLHHEAGLVEVGEVHTELNCSYEELLNYTQLLGLDLKVIPAAVRNYLLNC